MKTKQQRLVIAIRHLLANLPRVLGEDGGDRRRSMDQYLATHGKEIGSLAAVMVASSAVTMALSLRDEVWFWMTFPTTDKVRREPDAERRLAYGSDWTLTFLLDDGDPNPSYSTVMSTGMMLWHVARDPRERAQVAFMTAAKALKLLTEVMHNIDLGGRDPTRAEATASARALWPKTKWAREVPAAR